MKFRLSISVDEETIHNIQQLMQNRRFRNKSHAVEYAINKMFQKR